ncbi:unnamed protein product [Urochloa humidicola]
MDSPLLNLKAAAFAMAVAALAATAEAAAGSTIPTADFLLSPTFLWVAANAIIIWLVSSSRRRGSRNTDDAAMDGLYTSASEYEAFDDAGGSARRAFEDAAASSKRLAAREARAAARRADRPRVRKKQAAAGGQDAAPSPRRSVAAAEAEARELYREIRRREKAHVAAASEPMPGGQNAAASPRRSVATAEAEARELYREIRRREEAHVAAASEPMPGGDGGEDEEDVSMDSLWESIVQRRAARPVSVQKSGTWGNDELPRLQRVAETAAAKRRREMRKSVSAVSDKAAPAAPQQEAAPSAWPAAIRNMGWRTRDVLVPISPDELLRRAESFIRRQHEHLRLQRQESEQRQLQLRQRLHAGGPALIRV